MAARWVIVETRLREHFVAAADDGLPRFVSDRSQALGFDSIEAAWRFIAQSLPRAVRGLAPMRGDDGGDEADARDCGAQHRGPRSKESLKKKKPGAAKHPGSSRSHTHDEDT